jgi:hypothetical protein
MPPAGEFSFASIAGAEIALTQCDIDLHWDGQFV